MNESDPLARPLDAHPELRSLCFELATDIIDGVREDRRRDIVDTLERFAGAIIKVCEAKR